MTNEEMKLLEKLNSGSLDGIVGNIGVSGISDIWKEIKSGVPMAFKCGPGEKFFNGKENEYIPGSLHIEQEWSTDEQKLEFLRKYGWLMKDEEVRKYSAKFKPDK